MNRYVIHNYKRPEIYFEPPFKRGDKVFFKKHFDHDVPYEVYEVIGNVVHVFGSGENLRDLIEYRNFTDFKFDDFVLAKNR